MITYYLDNTNDLEYIWHWMHMTLMTHDLDNTVDLEYIIMTLNAHDIDDIWPWQHNWPWILWPWMHLTLMTYDLDNTNELEYTWQAVLYIQIWIKVIIYFILQVSSLIFTILDTITTGFNCIVVCINCLYYPLTKL